MVQKSINFFYIFEKLLKYIRNLTFSTIIPTIIMFAQELFNCTKINIGQWPNLYIFIQVSELSNYLTLEMKQKLQIAI